jgi:PEGA domain-containing protein
MSDATERPGAKNRENVREDLVSDLTIQGRLEASTQAAGAAPEAAGAIAEPVTAPRPASGTPDDSTAVGSLDPEAGEIDVPVRDDPPLMSDQPTVIVRADKALARAREIRALRLQLGSTYLVDRDARAEAARKAAKAAARKELITNIAAAIGLLVFGALLFFGVAWYRARPTDATMEIDEAPIVAEETSPPPKPESSTREAEPPTRAPPATAAAGAIEAKVAAAKAAETEGAEAKAAEEKAADQGAAEEKARAGSHGSSAGARTRPSNARSRAISARAKAKPGGPEPAAAALMDPSAAPSPAASAPASTPVPAANSNPAPHTDKPQQGLQQLGYIAVKTDPAGASVEIDGVRVGKTPVESVALAPGRYTIWASKKGFELVTKDVDVVGGETVAIDLKLAPIPSISK